MKASDIPEEIRAEMDGKGAEPQTFTAWMNERTEAERAEMFGERNSARWNAGKISQTELMRQDGRALKISDL